MEGWRVMEKRYGGKEREKVQRGRVKEMSAGEKGGRKEGRGGGRKKGREGQMSECHNKTVAVHKRGSHLGIPSATSQ